MNKSLGTTVALGFAGMGAVVGTLIIIAWELTQRVDAAAVAVQTHARETRDVYAALALKAKDMRLHVVQVQQWLTDVSATRAAPGFDDGFAEAEGHAEAFRQSLQEFRDYFARGDDARGLAEVGRMAQEFDAYYATGQRMAKAYIAGGPAAGNAMMEQFDSVAQALEQSTEEFVGEQLQALAVAMKKVEEGSDRVHTAVTRVQLLGLFAMVIIVVFGMACWWAMHRWVIAALRQMVGIVDRVAAGDLSASVEMGRRDEIGQLGAAFNGMIDSLRHSYAAVLVNKTALDSAAVNVMMCDRDYRITYVNESSSRAVRGMEGELRRVFPGFTAAGLVGSNIAAYHRDMQAVRRLLDDPQRLPYTTRLTLGPHTLELNVRAIIDAHDQYIATSMEWADVTEQVQMESESARIVAGVAEGRLDERLDEDRFHNPEYRAQVGRLNTMLDTIVDTLRQVRESTGQVNVAAGEIAAGNQDLASRTEEQAASLQETASAMEEMADTTKASAERARQANELAATAQQVAGDGGAVVGQAVAAMEAISEASASINDIIGVIDEIAFQTNLLSLNAAVEAARAGEQGRGFAVVAAEVRNLARRSAKAAQEIKGLIQDSVAKVEAGTGLVNASGEALRRIQDSVREVSAFVEGISTASQEQSAGIAAVNNAIGEMNTITQQNAALVEEIAASADSLTSRAREMDRHMQRYRLDGAVPAIAPSPHFSP